MWSECKSCGQAVLLDPAKTDQIIKTAGIDPKKINDKCAILLSHCPACTNMAETGPADATIIKITKAQPLPESMPKVN